MDQKLIDNAVQTFCAAPEVYQQIFKNAGVELPDELVQAIKAKPEEAVKLLQSNKELLSGVVSAYEQNADEINAAVSQQTGMFQKGGKLSYLLSKI